jgi:hypothetical protein
MDKNINVIGILWIVYGALGIFFGFFLFVILIGVSFIPDIGYDAPVILRAVGIGIGLFMILLSIPEILAGYGVLKGKEWGRILVLILSFLNVLNMPMGTALSIYSFVILIKEDSIKYFQES